MTPGKSTIDQIFNGTRAFMIPFYQRSYVWDEKQWERFLTDMIAVGKQQSDYFLGAIILKSVIVNLGLGASRLIVIDGQQRLTTIAIFLKVLYLKANSNDWFNRKFILPDQSLALLHSRIDKDDFEKVMRLESYVTHIEGSSNIIRAYNYFSEHMDPSILNFNRLSNNVQVIDIIIDNHDDEQQIFDTINSLGVDLTTAELLKNHLFSESTLTQYESMWKPAFEDDTECISFWNQDMLKGRIQRKNIEAFLNAFLQIKVHEPGLNISAEEKMEYSKATALFSSYKKFISNYYSGNEFVFVKELTEYANIFRDNFSPDITERTLTSSPGLERINFLIYATDSTTLMPYVMYVIKNVEDTVERDAIFEYLESYIVRRLICRRSTKNYSDLFSENLIYAEVRTASAFKEFINAKDPSNALAMPTNREVLSAFINTEHPNYRGLQVLYLLESRMRSSHLLSTQLLKYNAYTLEHLMPQRWMKNWPLQDGIEAETRIHKIKTLGNFTIITQSLNSTIGNSEWQTKLTGKNGNGGLKDYAKDLLTMEGVLDLTIWDEKSIETRASWLACKASMIWPSYIDGDVVLEETIFDDEGELVIDQISGETRVISRDHTQYSLDGQVFMGKSKFVPYFVKEYLKKHPGLSFQQIKDIFKDDLMDSGYKFLGLICPLSAFEQWDNQYKEQRYHPERPDSKLKSADGIDFYVNTQWTIDSVQNIIQLAKNDGFEIMVKL